MSIFRVMMLFYIIQNFERIVFSFLYFLFFTYFFSYSSVLYHDGLESFALYKNPVDLYRRVFQIIKWYYYNRDALTIGRIAILSLIGLGTIIMLSVICRLPFQRILVYFFSMLTNRSGFARQQKEDRANISFLAEVEKEKFLLNVERVAEGIIYDLLKLKCSSAGITDEGLSRIREISIMRIGYEIEDLISGILVRQEVNRTDVEKSLE